MVRLHKQLVSLLLGGIICGAYGQPSLADDDWDSRIQTGVKAYNDGNYAEAESIFIKMMNEGARQWGPFDGRLGRIYTNLGECYNAQGNYVYAQAYLERGLAVREKSYGPNSLETVPALNDIGMLYLHQRKYHQSQSTLERALAVATKAGQKGMSYAAMSEENLAAVYSNEHKNAVAAPHYKHARLLLQKIYGPEDPYVTNAMRIESDCLKQLGKKNDAAKLRDKAIVLEKQAANPITFWNKHYHAAVQAEDTGNTVLSEKEFKTAIQYAQSVTEDQMPLSVTLTKLGQLYINQNRPAEALQELRRALPIAEKILGEDDPQVIKHAGELAELERSQGNYAAAEPLYIRVLTFQQRNIAADSPQVRQTLDSLATLYYSWANYAKAARCIQRALQIDEKKFGKDSPQTAPQLLRLGDAYRDNLQYAEAETAYKRDLGISEHNFGKDSPQVVEVLEHMNTLYQKQSDWDKAEVVLKRIIAVQKNSGGEKSPETIKALEEYAIMLRAACRRDVAEPIERHIAELKAATQQKPNVDWRP